MRSAKPVARPRTQKTEPPRPLIPTVAAKVAIRDGIFYYCATDGVRYWVGEATAATREAALLEVFSHVRADIEGPIRFAISVQPSNPVWQFTASLRELGFLIERAGACDQTLMFAAASGLGEIMPKPISTTSATAEPRPRAALTVATDGSVRGRFTGYAWLASNGRYNLRGSTTVKRIKRRHAALRAELSAIANAARSLTNYPLVILSDSLNAVAIVNRWADGHENYPPGFQDAVSAEPYQLTVMRDVIGENRERLTCSWVKGHIGEPLNEGADALARLASRYVRGDSDLDEHEYAHRASGLAASFAEAFAGYATPTD